MDMLRFKPAFRVEIVPSEGVYLISERDRYILEGEGNCLIAPYLDGTLTREEIVAQLNGTVSPLEVLFRLDALEQKGYVESFDDHVDRGAVKIHAVGGVSSDLLASALARIGVGADGGDLDVVVTDDYLQPALCDFNGRALAGGRPWVLAKPGGSIVWVGPLFRPGDTGCWECLAQRLRSNRPVEAYLEHRQQRTDPVLPPMPDVPNTGGLAAELVARVIARWVSGEEGSEEGVLMTLDLSTMELDRHELVRRPQCPGCGWLNVSPDREPSPPSFRSDPPRLSAHETAERFSRHVSSYLGAATDLTRVDTPDDEAMHLYGSGLSVGGPAHDLERLRSLLDRRAMGKGETDAHARASALCESLERYSGLFQGDEIRRLASFRELGADAIHPNACMLFSERQIRERGAWNATPSRFQWVPTAFDEEAEADWTPVWSLTRGAFAWLPTGYLYYMNDVNGDAPYRADSNGNAAGSSFEQAVLSGFLELVERDGVALWWYSRVRRPSVDLVSFDDQWVSALLDSFDRLGCSVWALDLVTDLGIPAFAAISLRTSGEREEVVPGFGAHLDPAIAIKRALGEMTQIFCAIDTRPEEDGSLEPELEHWLETTRVADQAYLLPDEATMPRRREDYPLLTSSDLVSDIEACRRIVEGAGLELLVLDQTRPDIGLPVAKTIVPGLRHFWARFAPGRLYDVPPAIGWLDRPLSEDDLNPIPFFL